MRLSYVSYCGAYQIVVARKIAAVLGAGQRNTWCWQSVNTEVLFRSESFKISGVSCNCSGMLIFLPFLSQRFVLGKLSLHKGNYLKSEMCQKTVQMRESDTEEH
jgi:hypothetical protein